MRLVAAWQILLWNDAVRPSLSHTKGNRLSLFSGRVQIQVAVRRSRNCRMHRQWHQTSIRPALTLSSEPGQGKWFLLYHSSRNLWPDDSGGRRTRISRLRPVFSLYTRQSSHSTPITGATKTRQPRRVKKDTKRTVKSTALRNAPLEHTHRALETQKWPARLQTTEGFNVLDQLEARRHGIVRSAATA
jgi:hypothetical protein